jgi:hypothetical protein
VTFTNAYADAERAEPYARLEFPGTYYLAFRDLPNILAECDWVNETTIAPWVIYVLGRDHHAT